MLVRIAIVGLGPWGLCALERIVSAARQGLPRGLTVAVDVIEPGRPGAGVYDLAQPDYLLLNNPCGQLSLYPFASEHDQPRYGLGLYDWVIERGYRWVGDSCKVDPSGRQIERHDFLPRRLMGEYLNWFYLALLEEAPPTVQIVHHSAWATDIVARQNCNEEVHLSDGTRLTVDHVILTSGNTANREPMNNGVHPRELSPYPVSDYVVRLPRGATVAVSGMGLVSADVITALTLGRGGRFIEREGGLEYAPSGREPTIHLFSRSGLPFTAKPVTGVDRTDVYEPIICTAQALSELTGRSTGARRPVEVRSEMLPLLYAEMHARYYAQRAFQCGTLADAAAVRGLLRLAWENGRFDAAVADLAARFEPFDPEKLFFGDRSRFESSEDYERSVYDALADDLREAECPEGRSPIKSAADVLRIFRDPTRSVVEQGGLSFDSYLDFNTDIRSRITRLVAGPPALRSRQLLALMDAGLVRVPYGPAPALGPVATGRGSTKGMRTRISSTTLANPYADEVDVVIRGHLEDPRIDDSASPLLTSLYKRGRLCQFRYGTVAVGSVDLTPDSHPIDDKGRPQEQIWMFGVLTEGVRHFTHYLPSPKSRIRAVEELGACVASILGDDSAEFGSTTDELVASL
jgi:uncharacterized NAD(P)/FAD-binding protein YdhS